MQLELSTLHLDMGLNGQQVVGYVALGGGHHGVRWKLEWMLFLVGCP